MIPKTPKNDFKQRRHQIALKLSNASKRTPERKLTEDDKPLIKLCSSRRMTKSKLALVAHYIATAEQMMGISNLYKQRSDAARKTQNYIKDFKKKIARLKIKYPGAGLELYLKQAQINPRDPLGLHYKAEIQRDDAQRTLTRILGREAPDKPVQEHINFFVQAMDKLKFTCEDIAVLCNAFNLSKNLKYHHIHNRLKFKK